MTPHPLLPPVPQVCQDYLFYLRGCPNFLWRHLPEVLKGRGGEALARPSGGLKLHMFGREITGDNIERKLADAQLGMPTLIKTLAEAERMSRGEDQRTRQGPVAGAAEIHRARPCVICFR